MNQLEQTVATDAQALEAEQYLTFILAGEEYAVDILRVHEIKGWNPVTPIPNMPAYIKGVLNLRGAIVPIIDLRMRFNLEPLPYGPTTVVVVLNVKDEGRERIMGVVVDAVSDTYSIAREAIRPAPDFGGVISVDYLRGLATVNDKMIILLEIDRLLNANELAVASSAAQAAADRQAKDMQEA